jgi:hypothetical protein
MALGSTLPLAEMSTRNISWGGKSGQCVGLTTLSRSCPDCLKMWERELPGTLRACPGLLQGLLNLISCLCVNMCVILLIYFIKMLQYYKQHPSLRCELHFYEFFLLCCILIAHDIDINIDIFVNCNCDATRWQKYSTHLHTNST